MSEPYVKPRIKRMRETLPPSYQFGDALFEDPTEGQRWRNVATKMSWLGAALADRENLIAAQVFMLCAASEESH